MLSSIKTAHVRKVRPGQTATKYVNFDLEDQAGSIRCLMWPEGFQQFGELVQPDAIVVVRGTVDRRGGDEVNLIASEILQLDQLRARCTSGIRFMIDEQQHDEQTLKSMYEILRYYPGQQKVELILRLKDGADVHLKSHSLGVEINEELQNRIEELLGAGCQQLVFSQPARRSPRSNRQPATA